MRAELAALFRPPSCRAALFFIRGRVLFACPCKIEHVEIDTANART